MCLKEENVESRTNIGIEIQVLLNIYFSSKLFTNSFKLIYYYHINHINSTLSFSFVRFYFRNPNWWRRRTTLERVLCLLSTFALIAVVGLVIGLVAVIFSNQIAEGEQPTNSQ